MNDNTETIVLTREYAFEEGRSKRVEMREPTTRDIMIAVKASAQYKADMELRDTEKERQLLVRITGLSPDDIDSLAACDYERLQIGLLILRADPDNRAQMRKDNGLDNPGESAPSDSLPALSEGSMASLAAPDAPAALPDNPSAN